LLYEGLDQQRDVFYPLSQWRDSDGEDVQPIIKVLPKPALLIQNFGKFATRKRMGFGIER
jgi:hypothetical protein